MRAKKKGWVTGREKRKWQTEKDRENSKRHSDEDRDFEGQGEEWVSVMKRVEYLQDLNQITFVY